MNQVEKLLNNIQDKNLLKQIKNVLSEDYVKKIKCMSATCKGRLLGYINANGKVTAAVNNKGEMYLRSSRQRLDGYMGFECWCGNDSRLAEQEKGIVGQFIDKNILKKVAEKLERKPAKYTKTGKKLLIDNFLIEDI